MPPKKVKTKETLNEIWIFRLSKVIYLLLLSLFLISGLLLIGALNWTATERYFLDSDITVECLGGNKKQIKNYSLSPEKFSKKYDYINSGISKYDFNRYPNRYPKLQETLSSPNQEIALEIVKECEDPNGINFILEQKVKYESQDNFDNYVDYKTFWYEFLYRRILELQNKPSYEGLGIAMEDNDSGDVFITDVFQKSSAENSGIQIGDVIKEVDSFKTNELNAKTLADFIRNSSSQDINLIVSRGEGEILSFNLTKGPVNYDVEKYTEELIDYVFSIEAIDEDEKAYSSLLKKDLFDLIEGSNGDMEKLIINRALELSGVKEDYKFKQIHSYTLKFVGLFESIFKIIAYSILFLLGLFVIHTMFVLIFNYIYFGTITPPKK